MAGRTDGRNGTEGRKEERNRSTGTVITNTIEAVASYQQQQRTKCQQRVPMLLCNSLSPSSTYMLTTQRSHRRTEKERGSWRISRVRGYFSQRIPLSYFELATTIQHNIQLPRICPLKLYFGPNGKTLDFICLWLMSHVVINLPIVSLYKFKSPCRFLSLFLFSFSSLECFVCLNNS